MASPLPAPKEDMVSELAVGYGEANAELIVFELPKGVTSEVTFLKLFVSTTYVDMTALGQSFPSDATCGVGMSPFSATRGAIRKIRPSVEDVWDEWTYVFEAR
jgi:hypothetical protein